MKTPSDNITEKKQFNAAILFIELCDVITEMQTEIAKFKLANPTKKEVADRGLLRIDKLISIADQIQKVNMSTSVWYAKYLELLEKNNVLESENLELANRVLLIEKQEKFGQEEC